MSNSVKQCPSLSTKERRVQKTPKYWPWLSLKTTPQVDIPRLFLGRLSVFTLTNKKIIIIERMPNDLSCQHQLILIAIFLRRDNSKREDTYIAWANRGRGTKKWLVGNYDLGKREPLILKNNMVTSSPNMMESKKARHAPPQNKLEDEIL